ncbi:MAG TPA: hypothetical protein VH143_27030 [Kofleriaceae bacterium]|jgi:hypothetical protein|nr:hypothetical protein [Kofleriaceae bacterium]
MRTLACASCVLAIGCSFAASVPRPSGDGVCMRSRTPPHVDTAVALTLAAALVAGFVVAVSCTHTDQYDCASQDLLAVGTGAVALFVGLPFVGSALYGYGKPACIDPEAAELARRAIAAANAGDCDLALGLEPEVRDGDPHIYATVLQPDPAFARCVQAVQESHARERAARNAWCTARRAEISERAKTLEDPDERAKLLASMPVCY